MANLLDDLRDDIDAALTGELRPATYWRREQTGTTPLNEPIFAWISYPCQGLRASWDALYVASGAIPFDNARIEIIASTLDVEVGQGDRIFIEDSWWAVGTAELDPAGALWICACGESSEPDE